jgi:hypothetical protein
LEDELKSAVKRVFYLCHAFFLPPSSPAGGA